MVLGLFEGEGKKKPWKESITFDKVIDKKITLTQADGFGEEKEWREPSDIDVSYL